jgi:transcriptional regulator with GAF, ATPase, and Fis domain
LQRRERLDLGEITAMSPAGPEQPAVELLVSFKGWTYRLALGERPVVLGRDPECDVQIPDRTVSGQHCRLRPEAGAGWILEDLGSQGGTCVEGKPLSGPSGVRPGQRIQIGRAEAWLEAARPEPQAAAQEGRQSLPGVDLLLQTVGELYGTEDLTGLLRTVVDRSILLADADQGALLLADANGELEVAVARDVSGVDLPVGRLLTRTLPRRALQTGRPAVLTDVEAQAPDSDVPRSVVHSGLRSVLCVPLPGTDGPLGVLQVEGNRPAGHFEGQALAIFEALAVQLALAVERGRLREARASREKSEKSRLEAQVAALKAQLGAGRPIGESPGMQKALHTLEQVARSDVTVCLHGETGTGKEVFARYLHQLSGRASGPFVVLDCGAVPEGLIESELFGHEKGAFTGAAGARTGCFRQADGGTIFLDEIGELPLELQPKLLRVLQERTVQPVGGERRVPVDVRVVCATHRDLQALVREGAFRQDLYYRLAVVNLEIPPLRERKEDILALAEHFLALYARVHGVGEGRFTREAIQALLAHPWPGNVRELQNRLQKAVLLASPPFVTARDLGFEKAASEPEQAIDEAQLPHQPLQEARVQAIERFERGYLLQTLERSGGNVSRAAELAGVSRQFLYRLLGRYQIDRDRFTA